MKLSPSLLALTSSAFCATTTSAVDTQKILRGAIVLASDSKYNPSHNEQEVGQDSYLRRRRKQEKTTNIPDWLLKPDDDKWWEVADECTDLMTLLAEKVASSHSDQSRPFKEKMQLAFDFVTSSGTYNETFWWSNWDALDNSTFEYELLQADDSLINFLGETTERTYWEFDFMEEMHQTIIPFEMFIAASKIGKFSDIFQKWETVSINTIDSFNVQLWKKCGGNDGISKFWGRTPTYGFSASLYQKHIELHYDQEAKTWDEPIPAFISVDVEKDGEDLPQGNGTWPLQKSPFYAGEMALASKISKFYGVSTPPFHIYSRKPNCKDILAAFAKDYPKLEVTCDECPGQNWINCVDKDSQYS